MPRTSCQRAWQRAEPPEAARLCTPVRAHARGAGERAADRASSPAQAGSKGEGSPPAPRSSLCPPSGRRDPLQESR